MQYSVMNTQQTFYSPRYWCAEWALTDSQAPEDDSQWNLIGEYTVPDVSVWSNTLYSSIVAYKYIDFELPQEILGHPDVYIRLRPTERPLQRRQRLCQRPPERKRCRSGSWPPSMQAASSISRFVTINNRCIR